MVEKMCPGCRMKTESENIYQCEHCEEYFCFDRVDEGIIGCLDEYVVYGVEQDVSTYNDSDWERQRGQFYWKCPHCKNWMHLKYGHGRQANLVSVSANPEIHLKRNRTEAHPDIRTVGKVRDHE